MSVSLFATRPGAELFSFKGSPLCFRRGLTSRVRDLDGGEEIRFSCLKRMTEAGFSFGVVEFTGGRDCPK